MAEPITLDEAKAQLRAEGTSADDTYIEALITAARQYAEAYCGVVLVAGAATMTFACFADLTRLTRAPVTEVTEVRYLDTAGVEQVLDAATYEIVDVDGDELRPRLRLAYGKIWPSTRSAEDTVRVDAAVGYAAVPAPIVRALLLLITHWFDTRSPVAVDVRGTPAEVPHAVTALLANYRR